MQHLSPVGVFSHNYGIQVRVDDELMTTAQAQGVFRRYILVSPQFCDLPSGQQWALLLHEYGHLHFKHRVIRWLTLPVFWTKYAARMWHRQECEADKYAVSGGYGAELVAFLLHYNNPLVLDRIGRIHQLLQEQSHVAHAA